jgi:prepilin-type N-terminal cleavage/methylation domain-containing protein/prepilin-type processing-associated H-X9-DG protein
MNPTRPFVFKKNRDDGFTFVELLVVIATVGILALLLLPALAGTKPNSQAFQCMENQKQIILAWQMYAEDNNDLLPPNDYPFQKTYAALVTASAKHAVANWVVGTMNQPLDAGDQPGTLGHSELLDPNTLLSPYITNRLDYHCPADNYIDPNAHRIHVRSYSMNSAVGTLWSTSTTYASINGISPDGPLGAAVKAGWLPGTAYNSAQTTWLTYGKMSSFTRPDPANTWVIMDENPVSINDGEFNVSAVATPGNTYIIDFPGGNHNGAAGISFADGHVIMHKWLDVRTYTPQLGLGGNVVRQSPDNQDCFFLAPITSATR